MLRGTPPPATPPRDSSLVSHMIRTLNDPAQVIKRLTAEEASFIKNVTRLHTRGDVLSDAQRKWLEDLYTEKTA